MDIIKILGIEFKGKKIKMTLHKINKKIPATVISGFLGSGKTSLIRNLLIENNGQKIALIINEFGDLGVDSELISGCGNELCSDDDIVELANGCICCTVADEFLPVMEKILSQEDLPDHIVIETSGLALPKPLVQAFNWPEIRHRVTVDGVIAVIDGPAVRDGRFADNPELVEAARIDDDSLDHENPISEVFEDQLACADLIVLNKADQLEIKEQNKLREKLLNFSRQGVSIVISEHAKVPPSIITGIKANSELDIENRKSHHDNNDDHEHEDFESFVMNLGVINDPSLLENQLIDIINEHNILRIKGFLNIEGKPRRHVLQAVGPRIDRHYDRDWGPNEERFSQLVFIAERPIEIEKILAVVEA